MGAKDILRCPMQPNDAGASTVGEYFANLLSVLWEEGEGFSGKRPFGNSSWEYEVYKALGDHGLIEGIEFDEHGYIETFDYTDQKDADKKIQEAIKLIKYI